MRSGRLDKRVVIEERAPGSPRQDALGERVDTWSEFATVRASIRPISAREFRAGAQIQSGVDVEIEIRYLAGVVAEMRVRHLGKLYTIKGALDPELKQKRLLLQCATGVVNV